MCDRVTDTGRSFREDATRDTQRHSKPTIIETPIQSERRMPRVRSTNPRRTWASPRPSWRGCRGADRRAILRYSKELSAASEEARERIQALWDLICFLDLVLPLPGKLPKIGCALQPPSSRLAAR